MMRKVWKYPRDVIQYVRSSYYIDNLFIIYPFLKLNSTFKRNNAEVLNAYCGIIRYVTSLVLRDSDTGSENVTLIRRSVPDGQETCSSNGAPRTTCSN